MLAGERVGEQVSQSRLHAGSVMDEAWLLVGTECKALARRCLDMSVGEVVAQIALGV